MLKSNSIIFKANSFFEKNLVKPKLKIILEVFIFLLFEYYIQMDIIFIWNISIRILSSLRPKIVKKDTQTRRARTQGHPLSKHQNLDFRLILQFSSNVEEVNFYLITS